MQQFTASSTAKPAGIVRQAAFTFALSLLSVTGAVAQSSPQGFLPTPARSVSTVPSNGDLNPYGVAFVPQHWNGPVSTSLQPGDVLVSNFNSVLNLQGTGTTIVRIPAAGGSPSTFFQGQPGLGLSTALEISRNGYVLVGNFPSFDGTCATAQPGSLLILDANGHQLGSVADPALINGPWDSTLYENGSQFKLFIANGLTGTVSRIDFTVTAAGASVQDAEVIASGYQHQCDAITFVDAPTGLVYDHETDVLYVASTLDNAIFAVSEGGTRKSSGGPGQIIYQDAAHLHGALAMTAAPNGDLLVSNNDVINADPNQPSEIVEFTKTGTFVKELSVDPAPGGSFGLNVQTHHGVSSFAAVDDNASTLTIYTIPRQ